MAEPKKYPAPQGNPETAPFWEAARQGKFMIKRCTACGEPHYFPRSICPFCFSDKTVWEEASGEAHPTVQVKNCDLAIAHGTGGVLGVRHAASTCILERV